LQGQIGFAQHPHVAAFSSHNRALSRPGAGPRHPLSGVVASTNAKKKPPEGASFDHPTAAAMAMRAGRSPAVLGVRAYAAKQQLGSFCKIRWV
jgi:hypothetical protein